MARRLSPAQARQLRLRANRLLPAAEEHQEDPASIVAALAAIQAQEPDSASLAIGVRSRGLLAAQVQAAREEERSIVRTWALRGTLHLLATQDVGWLLPLLEPVMVSQGRRRYAELGLDDETRARAVAIIRDVLGKHSPLARGALLAELARQGIPTAGQAGYHLLHHAGLLGVLCFGPDRDGEATFVLVEEWLPPGNTTPQGGALNHLVCRYLAGHGPARPEDLAAWSGLPLSMIRQGWREAAGELEEVEIDGEPSWLLKSRMPWLDEPVFPHRSVRLLPGYDPYLLGYRHRDLMVEARFARRIHPGGGLLRPTLIIDGRAAGTWTAKQSRAGLKVSVEPFENLDGELVLALENQVRDLGRFSQVDANLTVEAPS